MTEGRSEHGRIKRRVAADEGKFGIKQLDEA
jgi:hypothetical protein